MTLPPSSTRPPAVAGTFYPGSAPQLDAAVQALLDDAPEQPTKSRLLLAPHAGYIYSGPTAAHAYKALHPDTKRIVILGPTHHVGIRGMATSGADFHETPLGLIPTDHELTEKLSALPAVVTAPAVHAQEHSIEVHLPFLQKMIGEDLTVVPVAVGWAQPEDVALVIETTLAEPDTAVIISSDLSHYQPYAQAQILDRATLAQVQSGPPPLGADQACGAFPLSGAMAFARDHGYQFQLLDAKNSGDTAGDRNRVVGYAAGLWNPR